MLYTLIYLYVFMTDVPVNIKELCETTVELHAPSEHNVA
jgi:hypothetical protein